MRGAGIVAPFSLSEQGRLQYSDSVCVDGRMLVEYRRCGARGRHHARVHAYAEIRKKK